MPTSGARTILFLTSCPLDWGGSEELWSGAARRLVGRGADVAAGRSEPWRGRGPDRHWLALAESGVRIDGFSVPTVARAIPDAVRRYLPALEARVWHARSRLLAARVRRHRPALVVISMGQAYDGLFPISLTEICRLAGVPYAILCQKAGEIHWPEDEHRERFRRAYREAAAVFFVSEHNRRTVERQLAIDLARAEVVRNPFMVRADGPLPWPEPRDGTLRLACVGRMWPLEKAQDVLLGVLARDAWRARPLEVSFYGEGPMARGIAEMARHLGLAKVRFPGFADPTAIWREHHALALPARAEGLPLVEVEAMWCGRPVVVADAGGTAEVVRDGEHGFVAAGASEAEFDAALERAWLRRDEWRAMGERAAAHVRTLFPPDPCAAFAERLERLAIEAR